jgi:hypothetical protein
MKTLETKDQRLIRLLGRSNNRKCNQSTINKMGKQPEEPDMSWGTDMECEKCGEAIEIGEYQMFNGRCESCNEKEFFEEFDKA